MINIINRLSVAAFLLMAVTNSVLAAQTEKLSGRMYGESVRSQLPLGNGDAVLSLTASGLVAMSESPPAMYGFACVGMGLVDEESKSKVDIYCTFIRNDEDRFDIKGRMGEDKSAKLKIIGGSGIYEGATGKGTYRPIDSSNPKESGQGIIEHEIRMK
ncbi:MAG: hypothetical protein O6928_05935 [Gammaproteobacteria bacterium]|nr:hypothetical protein [Gammaproteobacteria bacterium]